MNKLTKRKKARRKENPKQHRDTLMKQTNKQQQQNPKKQRNKLWKQSAR